MSTEGHFSLTCSYSAPSPRGPSRPSKAPCWKAEIASHQQSVQPSPQSCPCDLGQVTQPLVATVFLSTDMLDLVTFTLTPQLCRLVSTSAFQVGGFYVVVRSSQGPWSLRWRIAKLCASHLRPCFIEHNSPFDPTQAPP